MNLWLKKIMREVPRRYQITVWPSVLLFSLLHSLIFFFLKPFLFFPSLELHVVVWSLFSFLFSHMISLPWKHVGLSSQWLWVRNSKHQTGLGLGYFWPYWSNFGDKKQFVHWIRNHVQAHSGTNEVHTEAQQKRTLGVSSLTCQLLPRHAWSAL